MGSASPAVKLVIFDLDGTLIDTGQPCISVHASPRPPSTTPLCLVEARYIPSLVRSWQTPNAGLAAECLILEVTKSVLTKYGKHLTLDAQVASMGKKPLDAWQATVEALGIEGVTAQQLWDESDALLKSRHVLLSMSIWETSGHLVNMHTCYNF